MQKKEALTLRIDNSLSNDFTGMAKELGKTTADLIRFFLKASVNIDRKVFKEQVEGIYQKHLENGIKTVFKQKVHES